MTELRVGVIDVYVIRPLVDGWRVLALRRAQSASRPGAWETVHGTMHAGEQPEQAAVREVREETGLTVGRLYNVGCYPFYLHKAQTVQVAIVFAAFMDGPAEVALGVEHQAFEWLDLNAAATRFAWPREREFLEHIRILLADGHAGPVEDVLRVL